MSLGFKLLLILSQQIFHSVTATFKIS